MGWFSPKCPSCDGPLEETGYSAPYPSWRCRRCIKENKQASEIKEMSERIAQLEKESDK